MLGPDAPLVFVNGVPASLQDQCAAQINEYAIRSAWLVIQEETQPRQRDMRSQEETQPRQRDMRSQRLPGNRAGVRDKVEPNLAKQNMDTFEKSISNILSFFNLEFLTSKSL